MSKIEVNVVLPGLTPGDAAEMRRMLKLSCWFCSGRLKAAGERKVVCCRCGAGIEWETTTEAHAG